MSAEELRDYRRLDGLDALPALLTLARHLVCSGFETGDPEGDELKDLIEACVIGAHRLRLRERLRAVGAACPP